MPLFVGLSQSSATALESLSLCLSTQSACFPPTRFVGCGVSEAAQASLVPLVVFLLFLLRVKSNLLIPIQQQQQQLIWWQATWRPECQKFCCGKTLPACFFSRTWLTCWRFSFFYVCSLYLFLCQDTSSGEPQRRSADVRVSAVLHQRWDHQVGSDLLICGLISEWFGFTWVDFTWVLLSHLSGWVVWTPAAVRT